MVARQFPMLVVDVRILCPQFMTAVRSDNRKDDVASSSAVELRECMDPKSHWFESNLAIS